MKRMSATVHRGGGRRTLPGTPECGSESVARDAHGRSERASEETSETACVHVDDAHKRSSTPDDHETERSSEWNRNLETFPGRVGAGTQRTVPSDADAVVAVSVYGRQRSGLGGVGTTCATVRGIEFGHASRHDQSSNTGTQPTRSRMAEARRTERDQAAGVRSQK